MVSFNMGENTSWKIIKGSYTGSNDVLSISCNYIDPTTNKIDVIVTIESLCSAHNAWVDKGDLYIGLARYDKWNYRRWYGHHKNDPQFDRNDANAEQPGYTIFTSWKRKVLTSAQNLPFTPTFYRVIRGKNKYVFHITGAEYLYDIFDTRNSSYFSMILRGNYNKNCANGTETPVYIKLHGALIHYRKASADDFDYDINNELGDYKNLGVSLTAASTHINDIQNDSTLGSNNTKTRWIHNIFTEPVVYSDQMKVFFNNLQP